MGGWVFLYFVIVLIWMFIWGAVVKSIASNRGYDEGYWFWLGFFLGWIGMVIAFSKPRQTNTYNSGSYYSSSGSSLFRDEEHSSGPKGGPGYSSRQVSSITANGGWKCSCGRINYAYVGTCACGRNKAGVNKEIEMRKKRQAELAAARKQKEEEAAALLPGLQAAPQNQSVPQTQAVPAKQAVPAGNAGSEAASLASLRELKSLLDDGIITQAEFDRKKNMILWNEPGSAPAVPAPAEKTIPAPQAPSLPRETTQILISPTTPKPEVPKMRYCPNCGSANKPDTIFCVNCGCRFKN